jgi:hypothetical protein
MFQTCIFCNSDLGSNQIVEPFPVGRRLAFDQSQGRLWVVCGKCNRWNLSPIEERWEAIEECERFYRDTPTRLSTENIGLARLREGLELVRIGRPQRPEFAAWRYGPSLRRRRTRALLTMGAVGVASVGLVVGAPILLGLSGVASFLMQVPNWYNTIRRATHVVVRLPAGFGQQLRLRDKHINRTRLVINVRDWYLQVAHSHGSVELHGNEALRAAGLMLPYINRYGASAKGVQRAVNEIERVPGAHPLFREAARRVSNCPVREQSLASVGETLALALEMISHEDQERRALQGELHELEAMWREADEIASIADNLLLPRTVSEWMIQRRSERRD